MLVYLGDFTQARESPGVGTDSGQSLEAIEGLLVLWLTLTPADLRNQARWLP
jgi:hypothetical protein